MNEMQSTCPVCHEMTNAIIFRTKQEDMCNRNVMTAFCCGFFPAAKYIKISQEFSLISEIRYKYHNKCTLFTKMLFCSYFLLNCG